MKETFDVLNQMVVDKVVGSYAIAGAVATYNYIQATLTEDVDVLISIAAATSKLLDLTALFRYLAAKGYTEFRQEGIVVGGWPVQFLPVSDDLDAEALAEAKAVVVQIPGQGSVAVRVLRPEHLVATAIRVGRPKDIIRVTQFLDEQAVDLQRLVIVLRRHDLEPAWSAFCDRTGIRNPLLVGRL